MVSNSSPKTDSKSGMYSDMIRPARIAPITIRSTGWIRLENRSRLVSFSSS